jgi:1-pyrroline-5-carboxylate dehydrogenase
MIRPFTNEPLIDFSDPANIAAMEASIAKVESGFGSEYPLRIGDKEIIANDLIEVINPSNTSEVMGLVSKATRELADQAIKTAWAKFDEWKRVPAEVRARYLLRAAQRMRQRRFELSATMVLEVGKNWVEADADTAEAIDMLEFYGREMIRLGGHQPLTCSPTEENELRYLPLGVAIVIPPWNFPNAIMCGMSSAAIVAGNTVVLKPSSNSPMIAYKFAEIMEEVGLPAGVLNYCPGSGSEVGDFLVEHPKTRLIAFTGSKEVGLRINDLAAKISPGQKWIKRVVAEMGGKDAIVVAEDADLEAAADGITVSAFGYQGQKCSACSRAIVAEGAYDELLSRVVEKAKAIRVGPVKSRENWMGPVISKQAFHSIIDYIEIGKREGHLVCGGGPGGDPTGYFIEPTIFADVAPGARIAQEEIFGPVLAFIKARDYDHALEIANDTPYGLTGSVYSTCQLKLEKAREQFHVGNLYLNRKSTGALVGVHPFGGFNMSGTDSKAGGSDYLLLYTQAKTISQFMGV